MDKFDYAIIILGGVVAPFAIFFSALFGQAGQLTP